jgi:predicted lipid carrier protein YhbT
MELCNGWFFGKAGWIYESSIDTRPAGTDTHSRRSCVPPERGQEKESARNADDIAEALPYTWDDTTSMHELNRLVEMMNRDRRFVKTAAQFKDTVLVLSATDTGRELMIELSKKGVRVCPYTGQAFDVKIRATEQILWAVLSGQMDADAAFFAGKASVSGSVVTAFRVKNSFLSLLQRYLAQRLEAIEQVDCKTVNLER